MGLPNINIVFRTTGIDAVKRSEKGVVALILRDEAKQGAYTMTGAAEIPEGFGQENRDYMERAFTGYINPPGMVIVCSIGESDTLDTALQYFGTQNFDYLAGPVDCPEEDAASIASWIKSERLNDHMVKAVLPNTASDSEAVINFTGTGLSAGEKQFTTAAYCSRIAGLIAGTPLTISCTYAPLPEITSITRHPKAELDKAVDRGELILVHDGEKVKIGRGVNSLVTATQDKGATFKKIKVVEVVDMVKCDIQRTAQDSYIGKYANSYDNKCLLITAIQAYFEGMEQAGILAKGQSVVEIDMEAQKTYLKGIGKDVSKMSDADIRTANTGSEVFLKASISILDAIEDISFEITI